MGVVPLIAFFKMILTPKLSVFLSVQEFCTLRTLCRFPKASKAQSFTSS